MAGEDITGEPVSLFGELETWGSRTRVLLSGLGALLEASFVGNQKIPTPHQNPPGLRRRALKGGFDPIGPHLASFRGEGACGIGG